MTQNLRSIRSAFLYAIVLMATIGVLRFLDWVPLTLPSEHLRSYGSVQEVRGTLRPRRIYLPSYYPQRFQWPPVEIFAQTRPHSFVLMHVADRDDEIAMAIVQVESGFPQTLEAKIEPTEIRRVEETIIKGRPASLSIALCADGSVCNKVSWREGGLDLTIIARESPAELIRIAGSVIGE